MFRHACAMGLEGIVSKRLDKPYKSGRYANWVKVRNPDYLRR
jgi:bifunctional non-homologous end joining protein LigD